MFEQLISVYRVFQIFVSTFFFSLFTDQPEPVDPGQPLVNTIRTDSAVIGGKPIQRLAWCSQKNK